jgi:hypothetical protein
MQKELEVVPRSRTAGRVEQASLSPRIIGAEAMAILRTKLHPDKRMVFEILPNSRQALDNRNPKSLQRSDRTDAR